jgi:drug/metabolite transporter (DMT)-like permease|uniref:EamA family transporter n=1 Tax=Candidatus Planktophila sp. TaxID=2175601 RepID=UPI00404915B0
MASLLALLSSALWGSADFLAGRMSKKHHPFAVLGFSQVIGLFVGLLILVISGSWQGKVLGFDGYLIPGALAGLAGYIGLACLYEGLSTGRMGVVAPISSMSAVVPLAYALATGDALSTLALVGVFIALTGVFCASGPELSQGMPIKPLLLALGAAAGFGLSLTFIAVGSESSALLTMVSMRGATFFVTISIALRFRTTGKFGKKDLPLLIFIGAADFLANLLLGVATTKGLVSVAMVFGSLYPIATALLAFKFLNERLHTVQYIGIGLAVGGVSLISAF